eukprot:GHVU01018540.1.p1 GENE.GHVU01018540.1~~GHVU01018540.1.p1  ORF type:complete len:244 (+),score=32.37 GHVU01018540.1:131-862(+)
MTRKEGSGKAAAIDQAACQRQGPGGTGETHEKGAKPIGGRWLRPHGTQAGSTDSDPEIRSVDSECAYRPGSSPKYLDDGSWFLEGGGPDINYKLATMGMTRKSPLVQEVLQGKRSWLDVVARLRENLNQLKNEKDALSVSADSLRSQKLCLQREQLAERRRAEKANQMVMDEVGSQNEKLKSILNLTGVCPPPGAASKHFVLEPAANLETTLYELQRENRTMWQRVRNQPSWGEGGCVGRKGS